MFHCPVVEQEHDDSREPFAFNRAVSRLNGLAGEFVAQDSTFVGNSVHGGDAVNGNDAGNANGGAILVSDFSPFIVAPDAVPGRDSR